MPSRRALSHGDVLDLRSRCIRNGTVAGVSEGIPWEHWLNGRFTSAKALLAWHDLLLFLLAYPADAREHAFATQALEHVAAIVRRNAEWRREWADSGAAGTSLQGLFSIDLARWLSGLPEARAGIVKLGGGELNARAVLAAMAPAAAAEAVEDLRYPLPSRIKGGVYGDAQGSLHTLVRGIDAATRSDRLRQALWEVLAPELRLRLEPAKLTRTWCRGVVPALHTFDRQAGIRFDPKALMREPLGPPLRLDGREREHLADACRGILLAHLRETDTATYAHPGAIALHHMGGGIHVALLPLPPHRRLPFDAYVGYVAFANAVPVAYGGAWVFPGKSKVGINVFPAFRGGPSAWVYAQVLRCYAQRFGVGVFEAENYQLGEGNPDGIRSGAYWFYHRLGFRTAHPELAAEAEREHAKLRADRTHRTPPAVLRRLVKEPMRLVLRTERAPLFETLDLAEAVLRHAREDAPRAVAAALGIRSRARWSAGQRAAFELLAPALSLVHGLDRWPPPEKRRTLDLIEAKGAPTEDRFVQLLREHRRLLRAWAGIANSVG